MAGKQWNEEARRKWGEKQRQRNEALKAGIDPNRAGGSGSRDRNGAGDAGSDVDGDVRGHSASEGRNLLSGSARKSTEKKPDEKPLIDLTAIKPAVPGYLVEYNELLDDIVQGVTSGKWFRKLWFIKELTHDKAKAEAELLWPVIERITPDFVKNHPYAAAVLIVLLRPIIRLRSKEKPKEEKADAKSPAQKEETAGT